MKKVINSTNAPQPIGPYSQAIATDRMLFVSGQIAINADDGSLIIDSIDLETEQVMENIKSILNKAGLDFTAVVKCSIFVKNMADFSRINDIYSRYLYLN